MRHRKKGRKLKRPMAHRKAMLKNLATSLIEGGSVQTTTARAKELRPFVDSIITLAKKGDLHARRQVSRKLNKKEAVSKLFDDLAPQFEDVEGGYTRIVKVGQRRGDNAPLSLIELSRKPRTQQE